MNKFEIDQNIAVGDFYEGRRFHPVICTLSDAEGINGTSLWDGSTDHRVSLSGEGPCRLSRAEAVRRMADYLVWDEALELSGKRPADSQAFAVLFGLSADDLSFMGDLNAFLSEHFGPCLPLSVGVGQAADDVARYHTMRGTKDGAR